MKWLAVKGRFLYERSRQGLATSSNGSGEGLGIAPYGGIHKIGGHGRTRKRLDHLFGTVLQGTCSYFQQDKIVNMYFVFNGEHICYNKILYNLSHECSSLLASPQSISESLTQTEARVT